MDVLCGSSGACKKNQVESLIMKRSGFIFGFGCIAIVLLLWMNIYEYKTVDKGIYKINRITHQAYFSAYGGQWVKVDDHKDDTASGFVEFHGDLDK